VAKALLKAGAEVNAVDGQGWTPTGLATKAGHSELAKFLAEHGGVE
jgi:ankyrin repeat protein